MSWWKPVSPEMAEIREAVMSLNEVRAKRKRAIDHLIEKLSDEKAEHQENGAVFSAKDRQRLRHIRLYQARD